MKAQGLDAVPARWGLLDLLSISAIRGGAARDLLGVSAISTASPTASAASSCAACRTPSFYAPPGVLHHDNDDTT